MQTNAYSQLSIPLPRDGATGHYFCFDGIERENDTYYACGWAFSIATNAPVELIISSSERDIGRGYAALARPDVLAAGAPRENIGFRIKLDPVGNEKVIFLSDAITEKQLLEFPIERPFVVRALTSHDVTAAFQLLFHRHPEDEHAINHQLIHHESRASLFNALFRSPEFHEKNMDIVAIYRDRKEEKNA